MVKRSTDNRKSEGSIPSLSTMGPGQLYVTVLNSIPPEMQIHRGMIYKEVLSRTDYLNTNSGQLTEEIQEIVDRIKLMFVLE